VTNEGKESRAGGRSHYGDQRLQLFEQGKQEVFRRRKRFPGQPNDRFAGQLEVGAERGDGKVVETYSSESKERKIVAGRGKKKKGAPRKGAAEGIRTPLGPERL